VQTSPRGVAFSQMQLPPLAVDRPIPRPAVSSAPHRVAMTVVPVRQVAVQETIRTPSSKKKSPVPHRLSTIVMDRAAGTESPLMVTGSDRPCRLTS